MGFITAAIVGGLVLGAIGVNRAVNNAQDDRKAQEQLMIKQQEEAKTLQRNSARQPLTLDEAGAEIQIGTDGATEDRSANATGTSKAAAKQRRSGAIGGLGNMMRNTGGLGLRR